MSETRQEHRASRWYRTTVLRWLIALFLGYHVAWLAYTAYVAWQEDSASASVTNVVPQPRYWFLMPSLFSRWICTEGIGEAVVVPGADLQQLPKLRNVYAIFIPEEPHDRHDIVALRNCRFLTYLGLGSWVTDDDLERVAEISQVKRIFISSPHVTLRGVSVLRRIPGLEFVDVEDTSLSKEECEKLRAMLAPAEVYDEWTIERWANQVEEEE